VDFACVRNVFGLDGSGMEGDELFGWDERLPSILYMGCLGFLLYLPQPRYRFSRSPVSFRRGYMLHFRLGIYFGRASMFHSCPLVLLCSTYVQHFFCNFFIPLSTFLKLPLLQRLVVGTHFLCCLLRLLSVGVSFSEERCTGVDFWSVLVNQVLPR
jgi:hypothetical protein